jgi:hypothetical protein
MVTQAAKAFQASRHNTQDSAGYCGQLMQDIAFAARGCIEALALLSEALVSFEDDTEQVRGPEWSHGVVDEVKGAALLIGGSKVHGEWIADSEHGAEHIAGNEAVPACASACKGFDIEQHASWVAARARAERSSR